MSLAGSRSWWWFTGRFVVGVGSDVGYRLIADAPMLAQRVWFWRNEFGGPLTGGWRAVEDFPAVSDMGWAGSNPRPTDYESAIRSVSAGQCRLRYFIT
jgi:hypothetical protein